MAKNVGESGPPSAKRPKLYVTNGSAGAGRGCSNTTDPNPGTGNADNLIAETSQRGSPQMGGQASLRGPQPGARNKDDGSGTARDKTENHEPKTEEKGLGVDAESNDRQAAATQGPADSRRQTIQRCIQSLVHACHCSSASCSLPSCQKMKRVIQHTKNCKRRTNRGCPVCTRLVALCCYHAKQCQETKCRVPYCLNIKRKLRQRQLQHLLQQVRMLQERMKVTAGG